MQQQPPTKEPVHQGIKPNFEGLWCFRCNTCREVFTSSQGLAGHQQKHKSEGTWIKGAHHEKFFCPIADLPSFDHQLGECKSTPTTFPGQEGFYHPCQRNPMVQGPCRPSKCPQSILNQAQQAMMFQGPRVVAPSPVSGQQGFYRPHPINPMVQGPCRLPVCPRSILNQSQQAMVLQGPCVVAPAPITPLPEDLNILDTRLNQILGITNNDDQEELDLELRL